MRRVALCALVLSSFASILPAQRLSEVTSGVVPVRCDRFAVVGVPGCLTSGAPAAQDKPSTTAWPILFSAVLPGGGQAVNGSSRAFAYLAVEAFAWASYTKHALDYRRRRDGYRQLAAKVARAPFSDVRPNGDFAYYERMTHYAEAGRYDLVAGGALEPETDTTTYNGAVWLLARRTYWTDPLIMPDTLSPEWQRAMAFYKTRAYDELYRWSWTGAPLEYAQFLGLIDASNEANRLALVDLGVVIANHVLSTVDSYISFRLKRDPLRREFVLEGRFPSGRTGK